MNRVYIIIDQDKNIVESKTSWCYNSLGEAKKSAKIYISRYNKNRNKNDRLKYDNYEIVECELLEKDRHRL
jgi:hypothetical protein